MEITKKLEFKISQWISVTPFIVFVVAVIAFSLFKSALLEGDKANFYIKKIG